jgi:rhodanese-related sulfurtransferase
VIIRGSIFLFCAVALCLPGAVAASDQSFQFEGASLNAPVHHRFFVPNDGSGPSEISAVDVSCDCLNVMAYSGTVEPGSKGVVDAIFVPDRSGLVEYTITVHFTEASGCAPHEIHFSGWVDSAAESGQKRLYSSLIPFARVGKLKRSDRSCYMDVKDLTGERPVFVDVRSAEAFKNGHIQGSVNIPFYAVKTKGFLKNRMVVLVDAGFGVPSTEALCRSLREGGFSSVSVLRSGIRGWVASGGKLGGFKIVDTAPGLSSGTFRTLQQLTTTLVVYCGESAEKAACLLPGSIHVSMDDPEWDQKVCAEANARQAESIIFVSDTGSAEKHQVQALQGVADTVWTLRDGLNGYVESLGRSQLVANRRTVTMRSSSLDQGSRSSSTRRVKKGCGCGK